MKVILQQDVKALGKKGQVVEVSDGYARNFLLPKKLGLVADNKNLNELKLQNQNAAKVAAEKLQEAEALKAQLEEKTVVVSIRAGKEGRTFGSVSSKEIQEELRRQTGIEIDKKKIEIPDPIKSLGGYVVNVKLHKDVTAKLHVTVKAE